MKSLLLAFAIVVCAAAALAAVLLYKGVLRLNYPGLAEFPVQGVDVSHHQGVVNWPNLKGPTVRFAYIKATEGADFQDSNFASNWVGAQSVGIRPGAYHYFTLCKPGVAQARNFLASMAAVHGPSLPPAVDLEFGGNCAARPSKAAFAAELKSFVDAVRAGTGCPVVLYLTPDFHASYLEGEAIDEALWVRDIYLRPHLPGRGNWTIWQYANRGRLPGVDNFIDLNVFRGSVADFERFRCEHAQPQAPASFKPAGVQDAAR